MMFWKNRKVNDLLRRCGAALLSMMILALVYFLGIWGFVGGILLFVLFVCTNRTVLPSHHYQIGRASCRERVLFLV